MRQLFAAAVLILSFVSYSQEKTKPITKEPVVFKIRPRPVVTQRRRGFASLPVRSLNQYFQQAGLRRIPDKNDAKNLEELLDQELIDCLLIFAYKGFIREYEESYLNSIPTNMLSKGNKAFFEKITVKDSLGKTSKIRKIKCVVK